VAGDTLYGTMADTTKVEGVPLSDVTAIQVQKGSAGKTGVLVGGLVLVGLVAASMIALSQMCIMGEC
jgi:hypothetical protein